MALDQYIYNLASLLSPDSILFGNTIIQYAEFLVIILLFVFLSKIIYYIFKRYVRKFTEKTETKLDDMLVEITEHPLIMLAIVIGFYFANIFSLNAGTGVYAFVENIVKMLLIIDIAWLVLRVADTLIFFYVKPLVDRSKTDLDDQLLPLLRKGTKIIIIALTVLFLLSNFGYDVTTLIAGLGVGGLAVALAAQDTVGNFISSLIIFTDKPFKLKDFIKFSSGMGTVKEVGIRSTRFETPQGTILIVPNNKLSTEVIENFSQANQRRVEQVIGLTYDTSYANVNKAVKLLEKIISSHSNVAKYDIKFLEFGAYSLNINARYWIKDSSKYRETQHEINMEIKRSFDKQKLDMAFPTQTVYINK